jgi:Concanavalin A-like lectin/glucanases superfamily
MLLRKHQYIALVSGSLSVLALVNCSDNDTVIDGSGGSGAGKGGATEPGAGAGGKANPDGGKGGANSHAGDSSETAGDTSGGGGAGKAGAGAGAGAGGAATHAGSGNTSDAGEGGMADDGGAAGADGHTGPHINAILKYNFDEGAGVVAADSSGSGFNGTLTAAAWTATGRTGAALALTGGVPATNYVTVPPGVFKGVTATTIATWVKLTTDVAWARIFDFNGAGVDANTRFMYLTTNTLTGIHFSTFGGAATREAIVDSNSILPLGVWKHLAVTIADGGKRSIYVDGFPAAEATTVDVPPSELEPLSSRSWIGKSRFDVDAGFNGALDDFTVYDRVLSATEIGTLAAPKGDYTRIPFDEATGTTSSDTSTRGVNATLTGATWASGRLGAAVQLSGVSQYVTLNNPLAGCTDSFTISMWVKEVVSANWARIFDFGGTNDNFMYLTPSNGDGKLQLSIHITGTETVLTSATTVPADSTWHHLGVVVAPTQASVFIDGVVVGNAPNPVTPSQLGVTNEHWLGKSRFPDPYFNGSFDEVRIACRAYTADEIKNLAFH